MLSDLGAVVIDADQIARRVIEPGTSGFHKVVETFGPKVVSADGKLDRQALAKVVFTNRELLQSLEAIVHPEVVAEVARIRSSAPAGAVVIYDTPLLAEKDMAKDFDKVIMVTAPLTHRIDRLLARGLQLEDIENRIANQVSDPDRIAMADFHIHNDGTMDDLATQVEQVWDAISS